MSEKKVSAKLRTLLEKVVSLRKALEAVEDEIEELSTQAEETEKASGATPALPRKTRKNPLYFKADMIHLNERGLRFLFSLFDKGMSAKDAALEIGIGEKSAYQQRRNWKAEPRK